jgi:short-subunit dehydrogenase
MRLTRAGLPGMIERGRGGVINVASFAGYLAGPGDAYAATKAWVLAFSDTVAASLAGTGVGMLALCPGRMRTGIGMHGMSAMESGQLLEPEAVVDVCLADFARGRILSVPGRRYRLVVDALELPRRTLRTLARLAGRGRDQAPASADTPRVRAA